MRTTGAGCHEMLGPPIRGGDGRIRVVATMAGLTPRGLVVVIASSAASTVSTAPTAAMRGAQAPGALGTQPGTLASLNTAQLANSQVIYEVSQHFGLPGRAAVSAKAAALRASALVDLFGGNSHQVTSTARVAGTNAVNPGRLAHAEEQGGTVDSRSTAAPARFSAVTGAPAATVTATGQNAFHYSGLGQAACAAAGVRNPRTTHTQITGGTVVTSAADLKPGDLVLIRGSGLEGNLPGHVAMNMGDGLVIYNPRIRAVVHVNDYAQAWA